MNQSGVLNLSKLTSQEDAQTQAEKISMYISPSGEFVKANAVEFLNAAYDQLVSPQTTPLSKCMTLHVFKELTYRTETKIFSLMSQHKVLDFMQTEAETVDPKKVIHEKGAKRFTGSPDIGKEYMMVLLELIQAWGEKFAKGKNSEPTRFKKNLLDLINAGVVMPDQHIYIDVTQIKSRAKKVSKDGTSNSQKAPQQKRATPSSNPKASSIDSELRFTRDKINLFFGDIEDQDDPDKISKCITKNHDFFKKEMNKYQQKMPHLESMNLTEEQLENFFKIQDFLQTEQKIYQRDIAKNQDPKSYIDQLKITSEKLGGFVDAAGSANSSPSIPVPPVHKKPSNQMEKYQGPSKIERPPQPKNTNDVSDAKVLKKNILDTVYERFADRSKSPDVGFKTVQKQLQKEKEIAKKNPIRSTSRSPKPINRSGLGASRTGNSLKESKVSPIFSNPPNPNISPKNFQGNGISANRELGKAVFNIKKQQGIKRFKSSNFKDKNPLFENEHIQVGYKSQSLYQSINGFTQFIFLNIYIGNKTDEVVKDFQVEYKGDANQLLYANPRSVDSLIPAGYQNKHDLLITPLRLPYCLLTMHISYKFHNSEIMTSIVLPNSILKFASYMRITKKQLWESWGDSEKYKTDAFQLCTSLPPDSLTRYLPALQYLSEYSDFAAPNSQTDLELFCKVIMLQKYEGILKINIRPNLDVVLQLGSLQSSSEATEYFTFYLQTLELVMKQIAI